MRKAVVLFAALLCSTAFAQTAAYSTDQLLQMAAQMREQAKNTKDAGTGILEKHLDANTILAFRDRDGKGEQHQQSQDVFFVLQGTATLVTGGTISNPETTAPGEIRGASVQNGDRHKLQEGDVVHIAANTPHQMLLDSGSSITYFVVKIPTVHP
jgi:mannose-6-phosphate isomerase-like protein (cupin superfamily)